MCALGEQGSVWQNGQIWTYLGKLLGGASGNTRLYKSWYWNKVAMIIHNPRNPPSLPHLPTPPPDAKSPTGDAPGRSASSSLLFSWIFEVESLKLIEDWRRILEDDAPPPWKSPICPIWRKCANSPSWFPVGPPMTSRRYLLHHCMSNPYNRRSSVDNTVTIVVFEMNVHVVTGCVTQQLSITKLGLSKLISIKP